MALDALVGPDLRNELLTSLPSEVLDALRPHLQRVTIVMSQVLHEIGAQIEDVYFIEEGLVASLADTAEKESVEVGLIGREGLAGLSVLLIPGTAAYHRAIVQVPGVAWRLRASVLVEMADHFPVLRARLLRYQHFLMVHASQIGACNARHDLPRRLARCFLMTSDRLGAEELPITQEAIAVMLGVRRASVSASASELESRGFIRQTRGRILITDRSGLEQQACGCYRMIEDSRVEIMRDDDAAIP